MLLQADIEVSGDVHFIPVVSCRCQFAMTR
jgi:hypothetical protein